MTKRALIVMTLVLLGAVTIWLPLRAERQKAGGGLQWIWFNEGGPGATAPAGTRYFRTVFRMDRPFVDEATLDITADNTFTVWFNGVKVGSGDDWQRVYSFNVKKHFVQGFNVLAVEATNTTAGAAGLLVRLNYVPNGQSKVALLSDGSWKAAQTAQAGWEKPDFHDRQWAAVKVIGDYGKVGPWKGIKWDAGGDDRFAIPAGFTVVQAVKIPDDDPKFSLVNMCFDGQGRLLVSRENGPVLLCTDPDKDGTLQKVSVYCDIVKNCQGMCSVKDALLLVGNGPKGTGLYRCKDSKQQGKIDSAELLVAFQGGMGEHGPHAIIHGPDDMLYLVVGNHAHTKVDKLASNSPLRRWPDGQMGPDQGKPGTTEDVLLPRLNDARGHAANILAPGGTIWRMDHDAKELALVVAGFRNHFDAAFSPEGELWTFDSDMEWDEGLPWYRPVRISHCPPGADFVWRTGAANTPSYYIDSLPPVYETGRGSPVGVEFYDHVQFPEKYRGCCFMCDWSLGIIYAVFPKRNGASYTATVEKFCTGNPLNVTDCAVAKDGSLVFTMGGRNTQGGVYRIRYGTGTVQPGLPADARPIQPLAAWARAEHPIPRPSAEIALKRPHGAESTDAAVRAQAIWQLGFGSPDQSKTALIQALHDEDALVRRRACDSLIRAGIEPPVEALWPLLGDKDHFLRTAARLVLQRIDPARWADRLWHEQKDLVAYEGIVALCKIDKAAPYAEPLFARLLSAAPKETQDLLDFVRTLQLGLIHVSARPSSVEQLAQRCDQLFPHTDRSLNRELAIVLTGLVRDKQLQPGFHAKLLNALLAAEDDKQQQIHYFYCLRLLHVGWTAEQKDQLLTWFDSTKQWTGGFSFTPFLENILRDLSPVFTTEDRARIVSRARQVPFAVATLLRMSKPEELPSPSAIVALYEQLPKNTDTPQSKDMIEAVLTSLARHPSPEAASALRQIGGTDPAQRDMIVRGLARFPTQENFPFLVRGLESTNTLVLQDVVAALRRSPVKPKPEDPTPFRAAILTAGRLDPKQRWRIVMLLRHWTNDRRFGADEGDWKSELGAWSKWFNQSFPKEQPLPNVAADKPAESKYKLEELLAYLEKDARGRAGDVTRGRVVFEKAQCLKCHKYGREGEGIGPDLTTLSKRFKRADMLESIIYPSKVISDQYRSQQIVTKKDQTITGLVAEQGDNVTILLSDGSKVTMPKGDIAQRFTTLTSVMPEKLLDPLTKEEIADLFAFMESQPQ